MYAFALVDAGALDTIRFVTLTLAIDGRKVILFLDGIAPHYFQPSC